MTIEDILQFRDRIHVVDIGAAAINEVPPYMPLLKRGIARLTAIDGDERQAAGIKAAHGPTTQVLSDVIADGERHVLHLAAPGTGMSSILEPSPTGLAFFNLFPSAGRIVETVEVETRRLSDIEELRGLNYLKMDVQGAELMILEHAGAALDSCVAIHLEVSFIPLYRNQPSFGDIDRWMRANGFLPHCFTEVKRWSIAPTIRNNEPRAGWNQLLECDIVYVRDLISLERLPTDQVSMIALIAAYCYQSPDLCLHAVGELVRRRAIPPEDNERVLQALVAGV